MNNQEYADYLKAEICTMEDRLSKLKSLLVSVETLDNPMTKTKRRALSGGEFFAAKKRNDEVRAWLSTVVAVRGEVKKQDVCSAFPDRKSKDILNILAKDYRYDSASDSYRPKVLEEKRIKGCQ